ncbi:DUF4837 family protein [Marixanthomonas spongiae]|uniref:DUF4837 domain-containing protein n=1 Tax=Marixanthomonas spongiae TaxID=2174845 RepID=A0A2U0I228_9FLAO|nr:DUF4837 family protein [Marixanthomonas spongiae]PVW15153.1 DUF4837 domain-containing protein [Marixanthomonas spongiae]
MKPMYIAIIAVFTLMSCNGTGKKDTSYLPNSVGNINHLQVVINNDLWNGPVGEAIRAHFAAPTDGLPQDEPLFTINQMPVSTFTDFARTNRIFLYVDLGEENNVKIAKNEYARPQVGAIVTATSEEGLVELISEKHDQIIEAFHASEIKERQRRTKVSLLDTDSLKQYFGISIKVPSAYRIAHAGKDFYWMRKSLKSGTTNVLIYEVPLNTITNDSMAVGQIIKMRDSIGGGYLPVEDEGRFITEDAYAPYLFKSEIDGKFAYETKGTWEVKGAFMGGPFVNFAVKDEENDRYLILEGFTYAPSVQKRDLQFELESILRSARFTN